LTYRDDGALVRHHFGYVKVVTPAVHAPDAAVRVLDIETYGVWLSSDSRSKGEDLRGHAFGMGWQRDRRELIPLDCRLVFRVESKDQLEDFLDDLEANAATREGLCLIQD
jgi:hypothetical protein